MKQISIKHIINYYSSDKTIRVWKWNVGVGFLEEGYSPLMGHKYSVTSVKISPQVCVSHSHLN